MIHLDTSVLIDALVEDQPAALALRRVLDSGERLVVSTLVLYEWLRGPRTQEELNDQEALFPRASAVPFGPADAALASHLYRTLRAARARAMDIAIAACALTHGASLWTFNAEDFRDIPGLQLFNG